MAYDVSNPHPAHGKDPNIRNEFGHTEYPKWVNHPTEKVAHSVRKSEQVPVRVLCENKEEEEKLLGKKSKGWSKPEGE